MIDLILVGFQNYEFEQKVLRRWGLLSPPPWIKQYLLLQAYQCTYNTAAIVEQVEVTLPTAPPGTANQLQPPGAIYPQIALLADKLLYPPAPKPTTSRNVWDSDSD